MVDLLIGKSAFENNTRNARTRESDAEIVLWKKKYLIVTRLISKRDLMQNVKTRRK